MIVALSLVAAVVYGAADFFGGLANRRTPTLSVVVLALGTGIVVIVIALAFVPATPTVADLAWGALAGIIGGGAVSLLYRALAIGTMGIISPITAVLAAVLPVFFGLVRGERPPLLAFIGIAVALVAVVVISSASTTPTTLRPAGIAEAIGAGTAFGIFFIILAQSHASAGLYPLLAARIASFALFGLGGLILRVRIVPARNAVLVIIVSGALDMLANVLYVIAAHGGLLAIVAVLTSLYPVSTVALAALFLRERLARTQWLGVGGAIVGVACIAAAK